MRRGVYQSHQVSAQVIRNWVRRNPSEGRELLYHNPSYIFFREVQISDPSIGPLGAMNRSITPLRSIAVDPAFTPLGAPVWIEKGGAGPMHRLMIAQDTGGVILGPQRADIFFGFGDAAGMLQAPSAIPAGWSCFCRSNWPISARRTLERCRGVANAA